jgi:murein DD-endopeptidase MepM/ murein hydrolase activator NlpD
MDGERKRRMGKSLGRRFDKGNLLIIGALLISVCALVGVFTGCSSGSADNQNLSFEEIEAPKVDSVWLFGILANDYLVINDTVKSGWTLSHMLLPYGISQQQIIDIDLALKDSAVQIKYIVEGKPFTVFQREMDSVKSTFYLVYQPDMYSYVMMDFSSAEGVVINRIYKEVEYVERTISGSIVKNSNLSNELNKHTGKYSLTASLAEGVEAIFAWSIDFFKLQVDDKFVIVYDEKLVDGEAFGMERIKYMWFEHAGKGKFAFYYLTDSLNNLSGYYDEEGREMKRPFLMAPVQYARISSAYNLNRIHPIYKQRKAHLGTDYAAPTGTPILATADGTVTHATRAGGNGIYVKLKHNNVYETQYLHMSKIADGIKPGARVNQGQVIGFVGQTGAATGPHVCYRFWKNGKQVDHRAEKFPNAEPMDKALIPTYKQYIETLKHKLDEEIKKQF